MVPNQILNLMATLTCYYDVPSLPFPKGDLTKVALDFNINVFWRREHLIILLQQMIL
jgi:hypothetical protein